MTLASQEQTIIDNYFGVVTNKRVTYMAQKGWFGGGRREDVPLKQVVSVRQDTDRKVVLGPFLIMLGCSMINTDYGLSGVILMIIGVFFLLGAPTVNVITAGGTASPVVGWPWQKKQAEEFAMALRSQLFSE
jgi:hypothetical protein